MKIPYKEGAAFPTLPTQTPIAVKIVESEYFTEDDPFNEGSTRNVIKVIMEATDDQYWGARIWAKFTASIHEKAKLRPFIQAAHAKDLTLDELKDFDTDNLIGKRLQVVGEYDEKRDPEHKWLRPIAYLRLPSSSPVRQESVKSTSSKTPAPALDF